MNIKYAIMKNTSLFEDSVLQEVKQLNEGIRFFKTSKKLKKAFDKLQNEATNNPPRTNEEKKFIDTFFSKLENLISKFENLEEKFVNSDEKEEKEKLKKDYYNMEKEMNTFLDFLIKEKQGASAYIGNFFSILGKSAMIILMIGAIGVGVGATFGAVSSAVGGFEVARATVGVGAIGGFLGLVFGSKIAASQESVMKQKQALTMAAEEREINSDLIRKAKVLLDRVKD